MFLLDNKKIDINAQRTIDGVTYPNLRDPALRDKLGVVEVPDPVWPEPADEYYVTENEDGSLNITPKSPEQIAEVRLSKAKAQRAAAVDAITVTVDGLEFDGNETAQGRMARAALAMTDTDTLPWVLANNAVANVTKAQLLQALRLAGAAMAQIWVSVYA